MSLKEITHDLHHDAERTLFAKKLLSGNISKEEYAKYLWQMFSIYEAIEFTANTQGMLANLPGIERTKKILDDCLEIVGFDHSLQWLHETIEYRKYLFDLNQIPERRHLIKAHLYVRHMGDLFGGQIIAKRVPGEGRFYQFDDAENLKKAIRAELTDDLGDEARVAFQWAIKIMQALTKE
jgi:heme oxygenase